MFVYVARIYMNSVNNILHQFNPENISCVLRDGSCSGVCLSVFLSIPRNENSPAGAGVKLEVRDNMCNSVVLNVENIYKKWEMILRKRSWSHFRALL